MKTPQQVKIGATKKSISTNMGNKCKGSHFKPSKSVGKVKSR